MNVFESPIDSILAANIKIQHQTNSIHKKRLDNRFNWLSNKSTASKNNVDPINDDRKNLEIKPTLTEKKQLVTDITNQLLEPEIEFLSKGPKFAIKEGFNQKTREDISVNFARLIYHIRWSNIIENNQTNNQLNQSTNTSNPQNNSEIFRFLRYPHSDSISIPNHDPIIEANLRKAQVEFNRIIE